MSFYRVRPLGVREYLVAFEVQRGAVAQPRQGRDIREEFTLWDPHGRPHQTYPELLIERALTGREVMQLQAEHWAAHSAATRRLFGAAPLAGSPRPAGPLRGLIAFPIAMFSERGRWTLTHRDGPRWHFTPLQLREGSPHSFLPSGEAP
ncbi:MAG: hypothetical protein H0T73_22565 [Ardenticatenales bacterium]|nr:hypothetical protein [Ardenticatenales bacterium]